MMRVNAAGGRMAPVLMRGELMRKRAVRDGCGGEPDSAWEPVAVELREDSVTVCSADKAQVLCTFAIGHTTQLSTSSLGAAGHVNALSLSSSTDEEGEPAASTSGMRHLTLAASSETSRDKWCETLEACILKAQLQVTAVKAAAAAPSTPSRVDMSVSDECRRDEQIRTRIHTHAHTHTYTRMHTHTHTHTHT